MSKLIITTNIDTGDVSVVEQSLKENTVDLLFKFEGTEINYSSLNFGCTVQKEDTEVLTKSYPLQNTVYVNNFQEFLETFTLDLIPETRYTFNIWVVYNGNLIRATKEIVTPLPEKKYNSWVWDSNNKKWLAPMQYPSDGKTYDWDDENSIWVELEK
jgi:hypothetical protein